MKCHCSEVSLFRSVTVPNFAICCLSASSCRSGEQASTGTLRARELRPRHPSIAVCGGGVPVVQDEVQKKTDKCVKELDDLARAKEKELNTV